MPWLIPLAGLALSAGGMAAGALRKGSGEKVNVPGYNPVDPTMEQSKAVAQNQALLPSIGRLSADTNALSQDQLNQQLQSSIPRYGEITNLGANNLVSMLRGEISPDVANQISRHTAERSTGGGYGGSTLGRNLTARDLGTTSLDLSKFATSYAPNWLASAKATGTARPMDPASMFVTPQERVGAAQANSTGQYNRDVYAAQMAAAPDPTAASLASAMGGIGGGLTSYGFSSMGNRGGGGIPGYGGASFYPHNGGTSYNTTPNNWWLGS